MEINLLYVVAVGTVLAIVYYLLTKNKDYFHGKPIPSLAAKFLLGSTWPLYLRTLSFGDFIRSVYGKFPNAKVFGMFDLTAPVFVLRDPELIKKIAVKDFDHFVDHVPTFGSTDHDHPNLIVGKSLFALTGQKWKNMRATLSPAFTGSKLRLMFDLIVECSENAVRYYKDEARTKGPQEYEMKNIFSRFTNDVVATSAFGLQVDSLKNPTNEFYVTGKKMMNFSRFSVLLRILGYRFIPDILGRLGIDIIDAKHNSYFRSLILTAIKERETKGIVRQDMVNLLIQAKKGILKHKKQKEEDGGFAAVQESDVGKGQSLATLTDTEMVAQCLIFFLAGFDTVSTCLLFTTYELAVNPDIQQKLYEEIVATNSSLDGGSLTYDAMHKMKYLDMVVSESLRMWPPAPALDRICVKDYLLDCGDGLKFTIDKGTIVWIPVQALHYDPKYYPNPEVFDPERFGDEQKDNISTETYAPFGIGPRNCIGSRFALAEVKTILYYLLLNFSLEKTSRTEVPLKIIKGFGDVIPENGVHLEFRPRN
ncbi:cytochrome P450 9e2-like [Topomyia yanbarensis]|uniref:cytochrome P450 9e2-like n=1 Tax=Topomyia yanbarensis TaxID=2498891 RepID=UPI00273B5CA1|nr:cytochrome P450 9e2-like [Topomyia yanbarensis]